MKKLFYLFILTLSLASCVKDTDYATPQIDSEIVTIPDTLLISISEIRQSWADENSGNSTNIVTFAAEDDEPIYMSGYVVSEDKTGNFYEELFLQDKPENPTSAVKIFVEMGNLYTKFNFGRKVYVKLNGLAINKSHGEYVIGVPNGNLIQGISENRAKNCLLRDEETATIIPKTVGITDINANLMGFYVKLENMQFMGSLNGKPFVDLNDSYDTHRTMESCDTGMTLDLETSTFASFKMQALPIKKGSVTGIVSRDYGDDFNVLRVFSPSAFNFTESRCIPFFVEEFTNGFGTNWSTVSVTGPNQVWQTSTYAGNTYAKMSGYSSGSIANEDWLISKSMDLSSFQNARLSFITAKNYTGNDLQIYISTNYDPNVHTNPNAATWTELTATLPSVTGYVFTSSGILDINALVGSQNGRIAFKYTSTSTASATWEVDNVRISAW